MKEPYLSQFTELVRQGAGTQDIHDAKGASAYALTIPAYEALVRREVQRVELHQASLCQLLETFVGRADSILDVGCSTGGTTVAVALSRALRPREVIGVDPNRFSLQAARIRAQGYDLPADRVSFLPIRPGAPLPFADNRFQLTICVSVLEYVYSLPDREFLVNELKRVTRPQGYIFLATPNPFRLRDYHTRRFLGDFRRRDGYPWASPPWQLKKMFQPFQRIPVNTYLVRRAVKKRGLLLAGLLSKFSPLLSWAFPWQKLLFRKNCDTGGATPPGSPAPEEVAVAEPTG